jgi:hypothetical protein
MLDPIEEAEKCRMQALVYAGQAEARFLLRVAKGFEQLAAEQSLVGSSRNIDLRSGSVSRQDAR